MRPHEREQFRALTRAFLARFFENEITSGTDDLKTSFFWLLSFLAVPGLFMPMMMAHTWQFVVLTQGADALRELTRGDKAFYLGFVMVATAAVTAIAWNSLLADRRDGLVLGVLPVRPVVIVVAKLGALALYITLVAVAMNALASFSFGLFLATGSTFTFVFHGLAAHLVASVLASACVFLCVAGFQGIVLSVAGPRIFSRLAPLLQIALVGLIVAGFLLLPVINLSVADTLAQRGPGARPWLLLTPPLWFLGLYEVVLGTSDPLFHDLANRALLVTAAGLTATLCSYPLAYRRIMTTVVQESSTGASASRLRDAARVVTLITGRAPDIRAVSQFFLATLGRVERHRFTIAASVGVVVAWALPGAIAIMSTRPATPRVELLSLPLAAMVFLVAGLRIAVALPADVKAGWMFDVSPPRRGSARTTMERTMIAFGVLPVVTMFAVLYTVLWGPRIGLSHAAICLAMGVLLVQSALWRFRGMPCARPWSPDGAGLGRRWWMYLIAFLLFTAGVPSYELVAFGNLAAVARFVAGTLAAAGVVRFFSRRQRIVEIDRSAFAPGDVLSLN